LKIRNLLFSVPVALLLALFAVSNRSLVLVDLWPLPYEVETSVATVTLIGLAVGFFLGGMFVWLGDGKVRKELRKHRKKGSKLEEENSKLNKEVTRLDNVATELKKAVDLRNEEEKSANQANKKSLMQRFMSLVKQ